MRAMERIITIVQIGRVMIVLRVEKPMDDEGRVYVPESTSTKICVVVCASATYRMTGVV